MPLRITALLLVLAGVALRADISAIRPLASHPGNVFVVGEDVRVPLPTQGPADAWRAVTGEGDLLQTGTGDLAQLGKLPVGYYEIRDDRTNRVALAVIAPLLVPPTDNTPIALDLASAWNIAPSNWPAAASLARLAGVTWVRDRFTWSELEPVPKLLAPHTRFDDSAAVLDAAGLRVLTVNHLTPTWGGDDSSRFPTDLRDVYEFFRGVSARWQGKISAIEPWNEAEIDVFGGHLGCEIASFQKAAWLGIKAGNPSMIACQSAFAVPQHRLLEDFIENEPAAYFDTFDLHHYAAPQDYGALYGEFRAAAAGRPLWTTEANWPMHWSEEASRELRDADARESAARVAKVFAAAIHEGARRVFWFLLPHYSEGSTQFGLLRADLTPRPGYVALAAAGRFLAEAQPLGRVDAGTNVSAFAFAARPDGRPQIVVVAWADETPATLALPPLPLTVMDYLGRPVRGLTNPPVLGPGPKYFLLPPGAEKQLQLVPPPPSAPRLKAVPSPVVLQVVWPSARAVRSRSALRLSESRAETVPLYAYNFSAQRVQGRLGLDQPSPLVQGLREGPGEPRSELVLTLEPGERKALSLVVDARRAAPDWFDLPARLDGDFGRAGRSVLSLNFASASEIVSVKSKAVVAGTEVARRWEPSASGRGKVSVAVTKGLGVTFIASPKSDNRYCYPRFALDPAEPLDRDIVGLEIALTPLAGEGKFQVIVEERGGASYIMPIRPVPRLGRTTDCVAWFDDATWGATWSVPDANSQLDPDQIVAVRIGCNTKDSKVKFAIRNVRWLRR
ncbi:MAG TPA: hypothetical protein VMB21_22310 [Candidatus Limnocylindria bacterium]|jgi:hypothetical protein|nr:hypothetical protein [Candidatus Limnocylindria bacterium]